VGVPESFWVTIAIELFLFYTIPRTSSLEAMMFVLYPLDLGWIGFRVGSRSWRGFA
jgi:hypothetical protein